MTMCSALLTAEHRALVSFSLGLRPRPRVRFASAFQSCCYLTCAALALQIEGLDQVVQVSACQVEAARGFADVPVGGGQDFGDQAGLEASRLLLEGQGSGAVASRAGVGEELPLFDALEAL